VGLSEFERCLSSGRIQRVDAEMEWVQKELEQANYDLARARGSLKRRDYKWAIVQGYYSMFHGAKALVLRAGYREKSHVCLIVALRHLYVANGKLDVVHADHLEQAMGLRNQADYSMEYSGEWARAVVKNAASFMMATRKALR
jgi:uncharacterized protein (UPF0332 family)